MPRRIANEYGVLQLADCGRVTCFVEKPRTEAAAGEAGEEVLVSMGIYVFRAGVLLDLLAREAQAGRPVRDFGQDLLPGLVREGRATGYRFRDRTGRRPGYWRDVGTIDAYWLAHMELVSPTPPLDVADPAWPVWTRPLRLPPARIVLSPDAPAGAVSNAILSPGCIVTNAVVRSSVLSPGVVVEPAAVVEESVLLPGVVVERGAHVRRAIVDSGIRIPAGAVVGDCAPAEEPFRARGSRVSLVHAPPATMALRLALDTHAAA
jgi:glucose-1-phosphate adenylyltransferase